MRFNDALAERQPDSCAGVLIPVQSLEESEDALEVLRLDSDAIVANC